MREIVNFSEGFNQFILGNLWQGPLVVMVALGASILYIIIHHRKFVLRDDWKPTSAEFTMLIVVFFAIFIAVWASWESTKQSREMVELLAEIRDSLNATSTSVGP